ncbi:hypothetical protein EC973_000267 [Apophysomyces ossiformis]|uniref:E3 ubiquitin protein ligase n=1 Tax=Apophysomyces ossiformis TaxID=679940 RepID=A0A8H7BV96_9FUNG|nr:hypothetical protein EC973_000267 [Apophysomyces ossiformis]
MVSDDQGPAPRPPPKKRFMSSRSSSPPHAREDQADDDGQEDSAGIFDYLLLTEELSLINTRLENTDNFLRGVNLELVNANEKLSAKDDMVSKPRNEESSTIEESKASDLDDEAKDNVQKTTEPSDDPLVRIQQALDQQLKEVEALKDQRVTLKHQMCQLEVDLVAIPGTRIYKTTLGRQLYQSREYHKDKYRNILSVFEKLRRDLEEAQGSRRRFVKELDAKQVSHIKGLEDQLHRLESDLTRIRGQRDALQVQLEEHKACAESGRISVNELRVIMETRMERASCLEIELARLQRKNIAMLGDRRIYQLFASTSSEGKLIETLQEKLRTANERIKELRSQLTADIKAVDSIESLLDEELKWTVKANRIQDEVDKFTERYGFEPSMSDRTVARDTLQAKIEAVQTKVKEASQKVARLESTEKQFLAEIQSVTKVYDELEEQNMVKIQALRRTEDDIMSLQLKRFKYSQTFTALNKSKDSYTMVANALTKQVEKQLAYIKQLNEREKNLTGQITVLDRDLNAGNAALQIYTQKVTEIKAVIKDLEDKIYLTRRKVEESENLVKEKIRQFEDEASARKRLDESHELLRRKLDATKKVDSPNEMRPLYVSILMTTFDGFDDVQKQRCRHQRLLSHVYHDKKDKMAILLDSQFSDTTLYQDNHPQKTPSYSSWRSIFATGPIPFHPPGWPVVFTYIMLSFFFLVFSGELLYSRQTTGKFIELAPLNTMIGPSAQVLIQMGARFTPCMRNMTTVPSSDRYVCLNATQDAYPGLLNPVVDLTDPGGTCSLADICGMGGFQNPNQSFRFLTTLFLNSGIIQLFIYILLHLVLTIRVERAINAIRFGALYLLTGVFGNIFGANFTSPFTPMVGCSSSLFGIMACLFVDLGVAWHLVDQPFRHLIKLVVLTALGFILGLLPG